MKRARKFKRWALIKCEVKPGPEAFVKVPLRLIDASPDIEGFLKPLRDHHQITDGPGYNLVISDSVESFRAWDDKLGLRDDWLAS
jgi:hypothetical protein